MLTFQPAGGAKGRAVADSAYTRQVGSSRAEVGFSPCKRELPTNLVPRGEDENQQDMGDRLVKKGEMCNIGQARKSNSMSDFFVKLDVRLFCTT